VTTPTTLALDVSGVRYLRAEDETGAFGVLPGHADFLTVLAVSVITWRTVDSESHHMAVRGGVLTVREGREIRVASREAIGEDALARLGDTVLARFREEAAAETESRMGTARLYLATIRQLQRYLQSGREARPIGAPPNPEAGRSRGGPRPAGRTP